MLNISFALSLNSIDCSTSPVHTYILTPVDKIDQTRYGWLASVENEQLLLRLKKLSKKDLELLTLLFVDGYRQIDVARLWHCSRSAVAQRFKKIKKFLNNT